MNKIKNFWGKIYLFHMPIHTKLITMSIWIEYLFNHFVEWQNPLYTFFNSVSEVKLVCVSKADVNSKAYYVMSLRRIIMLFILPHNTKDVV